MTRERFAFFFLILALFCFGFDLFHFSHHLIHDPELLALPGIPWKLAWKGMVFVGTFGLLVFSQRIFLVVAATLLILTSGVHPGLAGLGSSDCGEVPEMMEESGIARDAKEDFWGRIKITPPRSSFPPEMDKITWWGTFKPFEFWRSPQFEAVWINPAGEEVGRTPFRAGRCRLAKATLGVKELPPGRLQPGMWRVVVNCGEVVVDNHPFAVIGSPASGQDQGKGKDTGIMIWADDVTKE